MTAKRCRKCRLGVWVTAEGMRKKRQGQDVQIMCVVCVAKEKEA